MKIPRSRLEAGEVAVVVDLVVSLAVVELLSRFLEEEVNGHTIVKRAQMRSLQR